jgi:hypothetical protein
MRCGRDVYCQAYVISKIKLTHSSLAGKKMTIRAFYWNPKSKGCDVGKGPAIPSSHGIQNAQYPEKLQDPS